MEVDWKREVAKEITHDQCGWHDDESEIIAFINKHCPFKDGVLYVAQDNLKEETPIWCRFGWHTWLPWVLVHISPPIHAEDDLQQRRCARCGRYQRAWLRGQVVKAITAE